MDSKEDFAPQINDSSIESQLIGKLDVTIKRIDEFKNAQSFNKVNLRQLTDKHKELNKKRKLRIKSNGKIDDFLK